jgi:predicted acetylornithine/succinylornithine family transaminase
MSTENTDTPTTPLPVSDVLSVENRHTSGVYPKRPIVLVSGQGSRVTDETGREYLDAAAGHGVAVLGHGHPALVRAVETQVRRLVTCPETYPNDRRAELMTRLAAITPGDLDRFFFCNSGTEAVEAALKFARLVTGRTGIVATKRGFHGRTMGALSATADRRHREPFEPLVPGFTHVAYDNLAAMDAAIGDDTAAVILEVVQGEGGVHVASGEYLSGLRALCTERGALLIVDEIQTGFGRTGATFACEHFDLIPDLLCLGKALAGGIPMGAVAFGARVGELPRGAHGSTFGGNPLACAAALSVLDVLADEGLAERANELGTRIRSRLSELDAPMVREVRGLGLMIGIELRTRVTPSLIALLERGVLALPAGPTVLRLLPPLTIPTEDLDRILDEVCEVLMAVQPPQARPSR